MNKQMKKYQGLTKKDLEKKLKEIEIRIMQSSRKFVSPKEKYENYTRLRKEKARILTLLKQMEELK